MEISFILGNIFSLLSSVFVLISVAVQSKKKLIKIQTISIFFYILTCVALSVYSALVSIFIALIRNILAYKNLLTKNITFILCLLVVVLGIYVNNTGMIGLLPIVAIVCYTILIYITKNEQQMRYAVVLYMILWFIQNIYIKAYPSAITNAIVFLWTIFQIFKHRCKK